ncbi:hypothetical protein CRV24_002926 [Beauveria bassiana]|nr:hypothetical protein CRV24_002926 [Beauveria bassiana]KAH8718314.1 hypothetical protein HC256_002962 [Beauveria bassiana]
MASKESTVSNANKGKASVWTEEAKASQPLLSVPLDSAKHISSLLKQGKTINWSGIKMKDRNTKSLTNQWTKIGKDMAALEDLEGDAGSAAPTPTKGGAAKRKMAVKNEDGDEALEAPVKKRGRVATLKKESKVKKEAEGDEQEEDIDEI